MSTDPDKALTNAELLSELWGLLGELGDRIDNYLDAAGESEVVGDEGIVLVTKAEQLLSDHWLDVHRVMKKMVKVGAYRETVDA